MGLAAITSALAILLLWGAEVEGSYQRYNRVLDTGDSEPAVLAAASSEDCVLVPRGPPPFRRFGEVEVASCDALEALRNETDAQVAQLNQTLSDLADTVDSLEDRLDNAENRLGNLAEPGSPLAPTLSLPRGTRRICEVNSLLDVAEICRFSGVRVPDPFFFHIPCDDPVVVAALGPTSCPDGSDFYVIEPGCLTPNRDVDFFDCFLDPPPGATCQNIVIISCTGYTTGGLNTPLGTMQEMDMASA